MYLPEFIHGHVTADGTFAAVSIHTPAVRYLQLNLTKGYGDEIEVTISPRSDTLLAKVLGY